MLSGITGDDEENMCPKLTMKQRAIGFFVCVGLGLVLSLMSWLAIISRDYVQFGVFCSLANVISISGSCFFMGPMKQLKRMFLDTRLEVTVILLVTMVWTLIAAFWIANVAIVILFCIIQYASLIWYGLSYMPLDIGRKTIKKFIGIS